MNYINYISYFFILLGTGYIYDKLKLKEIYNEDNDYKMVSKYLLTDSKNKDLPFIWIHLNDDTNARDWENFGSRTNNNINLPYLDITIQTIIDKCKDDFNICLINDNSFKILLPDCVIDINKLADPIKSKFRDLSIAKILHKYGGIYLPPSFVCMKNLKQLYDTQCYVNKIFIGEMLNNMVNPESLSYYPSNKFIIASKSCAILNEYIEYLEYLISTDYSNESTFLNSCNYYLNNKIKENKIELISAELIGVRDKNKNKITLDRLFEEQSDIILDDNCLGIYIDSDILLKRKKYNWFCYLSTDELSQVNNFIINKLKDILI